MGILSSWTRVVKEELGFLETCIENSPKPLRLLYAMAPPPAALPMFYPVLWPNILEPYDGERYAELVQRLQKWGDQVKENEIIMKEVMEKNPDPEMCKNLFEDWVSHQRRVLSICNELIQHSIKVQRAP